MHKYLRTLFIVVLLFSWQLLPAQIKERIILNELDSYYSSLEISPCGKIFVTGDNAGTIRVWDLKSGGLSQEFKQGENIGIHTLTFSQNCNLLASTNSEGWIDVYDIESKKPANHFRLSDKKIPQKIFFLDDQNLLLSTQHGIVNYNRDLAQVTYPFPPGHSQIFDYNAQHDLLLVGTRDSSQRCSKKLIVFKRSSLEEIRVYEKHNECVTRAYFAYDATIVVSISGSEWIKVWKVNDDKNLFLLPNSKLYDIKVVNDQFIVGRKNVNPNKSKIIFWNVQDGVKNFEIGFKYPIMKYSVAPDLRNLVLISYRSALIIDL
ncbi:MAG: hypothetical protein O6939_10780 [Bacteroidetes bacterium]|nr:hypothetical protein [Bacteroidota bacterium]